MIRNAQCFGLYANAPRLLSARSFNLMKVWRLRLGLIFLGFARGLEGRVLLGGQDGLASSMNFASFASVQPAL